MKKLFAMLTVAATGIVATAQTNPFFEEWKTPYGIPPFSQIKCEHYIPAIKEGIKQQWEAVCRIADSKETPTFDNTIAPLELSGELLSRVGGVMYNVAETDRTDELDSVVNAAIPLMSAHSAAISFNKKLYKRIATLYHADQSALTREQQMVLKKPQ